FRQAVAVGQEMRLAPRELVWLYFWLGEALGGEGRADEMIGPAEEALALLGEDTESVEAALMNNLVAMGCFQLGNGERGWEFIRRNRRFLQRLPYSEELRAPYYAVLWLYEVEDNVEGTMKWLQVWEQKARQHHDLRALGDVYSAMAVEVLAP